MGSSTSAPQSGSKVIHVPTFSSILKLLFKQLLDTQYEWSLQTPDNLLKYRQNPILFRPLVQALGLGCAVSEADLISDGLNLECLEVLKNEKFIEHIEDKIKFQFAISGSTHQYFVHSHWPPIQSIAHQYIHCGPESETLAEICKNKADIFQNKAVLDIGCSSGILSFNIAPYAKRILGFDPSEQAIAVATSISLACNINNTKFSIGTIGKPNTEQILNGIIFDIAIFNPPLVVPNENFKQPHRDGGKWGIELPLKFLDFAYNNLNKNGEVFCLISNPILNGRPLFFDQLNLKKWKILEKNCLNHHFNQSIARKNNYNDLGIQRVELWYLRLFKI